MRGSTVVVAWAFSPRTWFREESRDPFLHHSELLDQSRCLTNDDGLVSGEMDPGFRACEDMG